MCQPDIGGDGLTLWLITVNGRTKEVMRCVPRPPGLRADAFLDLALFADAWYSRVTVATRAELRYAHDLRCLIERNPDYVFAYRASA
jgi:hypothetical protein